MNGEENLEPVLAVKLTRAIWLLVFAVLWLGYMITGFESNVETVVTARMMEIAEIIDHEMDDVNDNYEASFSLLLKSQCSDAYKQAFDNKCEGRAKLNELIMKQPNPSL